MMDAQTTELTADEISEIERHKYFLSEKAGHDVGWEFAEQDWRENVKAPVSTESLETTESLEGAQTVPPPKGLKRFFQRLLSKAAV